MRNLWRDIEYGLRMLRRNKGFTAIAILVLALGIGPNVAIFSIVWATFLAPLPYPQSDQLTIVWSKVKGERSPTPADEYEQLLAQSKSFSFLGFSSWTTFPHLTGADHIQEDTPGIACTPGYYSKYLGLHMALGRDFLPSEGTRGNDHEVILTHKLWLDRYHGDPAILGKPILIDEQPYTVIGIEEAGVADRIPMQFYTPVALDPGGHNDQWGSLTGRLKPGVTLAQAQAELALIDRRYAAAHSNELPKQGWSIGVEPLHNDWLDKKLERNLWLLLAAVGFVLLIACANLANLLLARGSARQQEIAVRSALGATPTQVFAQLITESLTLSILGGAIGIALGWAIMKAAMATLPLVKQTAEAVVEVNLPVLCFAVFATLVAGVVSGCAPAWQAAHLNLSEMLKQGSRSVTGRGRMRTQNLLVMGEFALALTLLGGAGMALHSFYNLTKIDLGFRTDHILTGRLSSPQRTTRPNPEQTIASARALMAKITSLPGVVNVALATNMPLNGNDSFPFTLVGHPVTDANRPVADFEIVTPSYFDTFGVRLVRGRLLNDSDHAGAPRVLMVSQSFVDRYLQGVDPLQQRLLLPGIGSDNKPAPPIEWQIVGVFHDVRNGEHLSDKTAPQMFAPFWQMPFAYMGVAVRTVLDPGTISKSIRGAVAETFPGYSLTAIDTMQQTVDTQLTGDRFGMVLFGGFAAVALLLAALGIYGVMAFSVAQRNHEIGLRMALGARQRDVVLLIMSEAMKLALAGVGVGLVGVVVLGYLMRSTLYGIKTIDPASFVVVAVALLTVAVLASYVPARRSAKVDPMIALRQA